MPSAVVRSFYAAAAVAVTCVSSPAGAQTFTQIVSFGDSLSDTGNVSNATIGIAPGGNYFQGRYSNGPLWVEALAGSLNLAAPAPSRLGGRNYAHAGTKTGSGNTTFVFFNFPNAGTQVGQYLAGNTPTSAQIFTLYAGANDFLGNLGQNPTTVVNNLVAHVTALNNSGARYIVVPNLPLLGETPRYVGNAADRAAYNTLTANYNAQLAAAMGTLDAQIPAKIYQFDVATAFNQILSNPSAYGLTNVTQPALSGGTVVPNPDQYLFYDDVHPTRVGHRLLGIAAYDLVTTHEWVGGSGIWADAANWEVPGAPAAAWIATIDNRSAGPIAIDVAGPSQVRRARVAGSAAPATLRLASGVALGATESVAVLGGATLDLRGGAINSPSIEVFAGGRIVGAGSISGSVANAGTVSPGGAGGVGTIEVGGFTQSAGGSLDIDLSGTSGIGDRLLVSGAATLAGTLRLFAEPGQTPLPGNYYQIMSYGSSNGDVAVANHTGYAGLRFARSLGATGLTIDLSAFPGDANLDALVNIADFAALAANFNATGLTWLEGDFTADTAVTIADFALLAGNFNLSPPAQRTSVPEPAAGTILLVIALCRRSIARAG